MQVKTTGSLEIHGHHHGGKKVQNTHTLSSKSLQHNNSHLHSNAFQINVLIHHNHALMNAELVSSNFVAEVYKQLLVNIFVIIDCQALHHDTDLLTMPLY